MKQYSNKARPKVCTGAFVVAACLLPFVSHKGHMETFSCLRAARHMLSVNNICYLFFRFVFNSVTPLRKRTSAIKWKSATAETCMTGELG